jgi:hypothetical protein
LRYRDLWLDYANINGAPNTSALGSGVHRAAEVEPATLTCREAS